MSADGFRNKEEFGFRIPEAKGEIGFFAAEWVKRLVESADLLKEFLMD